MTAKDFNELLLLKFPSIKKDFDAYVEWQDGIETGSFLVVEDVFMKYFNNILSKKDFKNIAYICETIESILSMNDEYASNVIVVGILENLKCGEYSELIVNYLLPNSRKEFDDIEV